MLGTARWLSLHPAPWPHVQPCPCTCLHPAAEVGITVLLPRPSAVVLAFGAPQGQSAGAAQSALTCPPSLLILGPAASPASFDFGRGVFCVCVCANRNEILGLINIKIRGLCSSTRHLQLFLTGLNTMTSSHGWLDPVGSGETDLSAR